MGCVLVVGPFPPPVHGMSKNLDLFFKDISNVSEVVKLDLSPGSLERGVRYHLVKIFKVIISILKFIFISRKITSVYMAPDGGLGFVYSSVFLILSLIFRIRVYLHHRSFSYVDRFNLLMFFLLKISSSNISHIFLCETMAVRFCKLYAAKDFLILSNVMYAEVSKNNVNKLNCNGALTLGFLSNISNEKGFYEALNTFKMAKEIGLSVFFKVGGVVYEKNIMATIETLQRDYPVDFCFVGFVDDKKEFFSNVDILLFPTKYKMEAQPNVIFEAAANGVPVISVRRGCIESDIGMIGGWLVPISSYPEDACKIISFVIDDVELLKDLSIKLKEVTANMRKIELIKYSYLISAVSKSEFLRNYSVGES